jgi:tRNA (guanine37-N1)-methyltransferase
VKRLRRRSEPKQSEGNSPEFGVDVVGDIAVLRLEGRVAEKRRAAESVLAQMKNVKCVYEQKGGIEGEMRLRRLTYLAGEKRTLTTHRENGCVFRVDVAKCYFSPRLSTERLRIVEATEPDERILNMFAGVGPYSIEIARKKGAMVTSCELNPIACELHRENNRLNKVEELVGVVQSDARLLPEILKGRFDRILMPHPSASDKFIQTAVQLLGRRGVIHYYRHVLARNEAEGESMLGEELRALLGTGWTWRLRRVREVGPRWLEMAAEVRRA